MGVVGILNRARYYRSVLGTVQTAKLYAARTLPVSRITLRVPGIARPVLCRPTEADRFTLCHVFAENDAEVPVQLSPRVIVDGGANVGYVSVYYANRYPGASIVALEPDRDNFELARENCAPYPRVHLMRAGLWSRDAALEVADPGLGGWRSWGLQTREAPEGQADPVEGISIPTLLERIGHDVIDVLKLDIEGSEEGLFSAGCLDWLPRVGVVLVETHGDASERAVEWAMREASFRQVQGGHRRVFVNPATLHSRSD